MKKSIFGVVILLCLLAACAPKDQFTINGTFENVEDSTLVYLMIRGEKGFDKMDSCFITNSNFTLKGQIEQTQVVYLTIREFRFNYPIFVSPDASVSISGTLDDLKITGSAAQDEFKDYKNSLLDFQNQQQELYGQYQQTPKDDTIQLQVIEEKYNTLDSIINDKRNEWIQLHSNSVVAPYIIMTELVYNLNGEELQAYYDAFSESVQSSFYGKEMQKRIEKLSQVAIGRPAPEIAQPNQNGDTMRLSDLKGQVVLIDFWASWCSPCRAENPVVVAAYEKFHDKGFTVYSISLDDNRDRWLQAIAADSLIWTSHVSVLQGWDNPSAQQYGVMSIPSNFLIDKEGIIIGYDLRGEKLEAKLNELFPETL